MALQGCQNHLDGLWNISLHHKPIIDAHIIIQPINAPLCGQKSKTEILPKMAENIGTMKNVPIQQHNKSMRIFSVVWIQSWI